MYVIMKIFITNKQFDNTEKIGIGKERSVKIRIGRALLVIDLYSSENIRWQSSEELGSSQTYWHSNVPRVIKMLMHELKFQAVEKVTF
jgi:hypothetical protein